VIHLISVLLFFTTLYAADPSSLKPAEIGSVRESSSSEVKKQEANFRNTGKPFYPAQRKRIVKSKSNSKTPSKIAQSLQKQGLIQGSIREKYAEKSISLHYEDMTIHEVVREINTGYGINIVVAQGIESKVNIHLDNIGLLDGLEAMAAASGLELTHDGKIFHIREQTAKTKNILNMNLKKMDLDVENKDVKQFVREFAQKTGLKILASPNLEGTISGAWQNQIPMDGFLALMEAHGFSIKKKKGFFIVNKSDENGTGSLRKRRRSSRGAGALEVDFKDNRLSLNLENANLDEVIKAIAEETNLNIIFYGIIKETINAKINQVEIDEAFSALLKGTKYTYVLTKEGTILVGSKDPKTPAGKILTSYEMYFFKHIKSEGIEKLLPKSIPRGVLTNIKEQNAVLISGTIEEIESIKSYLNLIDQPAPQVLLECIIVEVSREEGNEFGVTPSASGDAAALTLPFSFQHGGWKGSFGSYKGAKGGYGVLPKGINLNLELTALQRKNKAKVLAMPRITTLNGHKSSIRVTNTSYYERSSVSKDGVPLSDYRPIDDGITLDITPSITHGGEISIEIKPEIKTAKNTTGSGDRPADISTRNLETTIKLRDGETIMLGGLIQNNRDYSRQFVPILGSIPIIGYLFSYYAQRERTTELVVFVTPHIFENENSHFDVKESLKSMDERQDISDFEEKLEDYRFQSRKIHLDSTPKDSIPAKAN
jgi:type IV pilus assembly protein PilQ